MGGVMLAQQPSGGAAVTEKAVLRGTVVNAVTHQPIGKALVKSTDGRFATMTNERGQFEMRFKEKKTGAGSGGAGSGGGTWFSASSDGTGGMTVSRGGISPGGEEGAAGSASGSEAAQAGQVQQGQQVGQVQQQGQAVDRPDFLTAVKVGYLNPQTQWGNADCSSA